jgi:S-adenosylmethionine decarboxylase
LCIINSKIVVILFSKLFLLEDDLKLERYEGKHIILEMYGCKFEDLDNEELILNTFKRAVEEANMTLLNLVSYKFQPQGVTAVGLLSESHISWHSSPERGDGDNDGYCAMDFYTCGEQSKPELAMNVFLDVFKPAKKTIIYIPRGLEI